MKKINFNLGSYEKFSNYEAKLFKQLGNLKNQLSLKDEELKALQQEYLSLHMEGTEPVKVSGKIKDVKYQISILNDEIDLIESADLKEKELSAAIHKEYQAKLAEVNEERENLWNDAIRTQIEADEKIKELGVEYNRLGDEFNSTSARQFSRVISSLDVSKERKQALLLQSDNPIHSSMDFSRVKIYVAHHDFNTVH